VPELVEEVQAGLESHEYRFGTCQRLRFDPVLG
jgi:hypothetical protein